MHFIIHILALLISHETQINQMPNAVAQHQVTTKVFNVEISVTQHIPYCGGATPSEEMLNRYLQVGGSYLLVDLQTRKKIIVSADEDLMIRLNLPVGTYVLRELDKDVPFEEFMQRFQNSSANIIRGDDECYTELWKSNLLQFDILPNSELQTFHCGLFNSCYTSNPCDFYIGPLPS